ncbi:heparinase II/III domain-containing protein [Paenibacillus senegalensis]|uniref:heparinase II/III domain-containing protein n=1 Tax=Paenibacillus senegalensis TaxID=1465766 RepID=UPI00028A04AF|nr:heparinase II/III family protein [Paenibacillus senegalensis]
MKTRSTYYTPRKKAAARSKLQHAMWARKLRDEAVSKAEAYLRQGHDWLWSLVTSQSLPRSIMVHLTLGSPGSGPELTRLYGNYGWLADPLNDPWKLTDPVSGMRFPSNDFASYYASGLNAKGEFNAALADPQFLVNELYPHKGEHWAVDDGYGWIDDQGERWGFIAYYNHWHLWYGKGMIVDALVSFRDAYLLTDDARYGEAGVILLDRVADVYPQMDISAYRWDDGYYNSHGLSGKGKVVGCIWETGLASDLLTCFDAFFPAIESPRVRQFLQNKASRWQLGSEKSTSGMIRDNIERGIVQQVYPGVLDGSIRGNFGMHQKALALAAVISDDAESARRWIGWILQSGGTVAEDSIPRQTGGNVLAALVDEVDRDGFGNEAAPHYNGLWLSQMRVLAEVLELSELEDVNLSKHPKFRKMFLTPIELLIGRCSIPAIGDSWRTGNYRIPGTIDDHLFAYERYGDPKLAQYIYFLNGSTLDGLPGDLFSPDSDRLEESIAQVLQRCGELKCESVNLTGYGFAALQIAGDLAGSPNAVQAAEHARSKGAVQAVNHAAAGKSTAAAAEFSRAVWMYYGRTGGHGHKDALNIGMFAFGHDLLPDNGYPEKADWNPKRLEWVENTVSHNTVVVDRAKQQAIWVGRPLHFHGEGPVQLVDVEAPGAYPHVDLYRRTVVYVQVDEINSYAIDLFHVHGGQQHHYSFHAAEGEVSTEGLRLRRQEKGTYASEQIEYRPSTAGNARGYQGSGFHYLFNVQRDESPASAFSVDWRIREEQSSGEGELHFRLTMLGEYHEAALANGEPPQVPGNPDRLNYVLVNRRGNALRSRFFAVLEPYRHHRFIQSIDQVAVPDGVSAVKITLADGRVDYVVQSLNPDQCYDIDGVFSFQGFACVYSYRMENGRKEPEMVFAHGAAKLQDRDVTYMDQPSGYVTGEVLDFTKNLSLDNSIRIRINRDEPNQNIRAEDLTGKRIYVEDDGERNAVYKIHALTMTSEQEAVIAIGDQTLIRCYRSKEDLAAGFVYDIREGARFNIPLSFVWKK